jgi:long-chain acyl-CoA synthetase
MLNLASFLQESAKEHGDKEAIVFGQFRLTYSQVNMMANQVANGLRSIGIVPGDKVALCCPNLPYFPIVAYGILKAGAALVPLNVLLKQREMAYHIKDSDAKALISFEGSDELPLAAPAHGAFQEVDSCEHFYIIPTMPGGPSPIDGVHTLSGLMDGQSPEGDYAPTDPEDTCLILYTSGTTGLPKGAELSHSNIVMNAMTMRDLAQGTPDDVTLCVLPLFHSFGHTVQMHTSMLIGSTLVLLPRFEAGAVLQAFQDENVTMFAGVPTMYWDLLTYKDADKFDLKKISDNLRLCNSGGAAMPVEVMKDFEEKFGVEILEGYGLSETSPVASFNQLGKPRKAGSIGMPIWGVDMKIVDDEMNEQPTGEKGEIVIRGHNIMKGYFKREEATEESFKGGWFHSGDVGYVDEDGYFFIVDRTKDMVIRGGFNVYPRELEEVLITHPAISLVAVIGVPHDEYGEEVKAYVVLKEGESATEDELRAWGKEQFAAYKYPRSVEIVDAMPLGPTGKILKTELRAMATQSA